MPSLTGHCMLLDGYKKVNGRTLFYINFGWNGGGNGYYLYDDKTWNEDAPKEYRLNMSVFNFHLDTDFDDFLRHKKKMQSFREAAFFIS